MTQLSINDPQVIRNFSAYFSSPTPSENELDLPFISPFDLGSPSYLDFTHNGVFAVKDDYSKVLPYSKVNSLPEATTP